MTNERQHIYHKCNDEDCLLCRGGLAYCTVCREGEAGLADVCPGPQAKQAVTERGDNITFQPDDIIIAIDNPEWGTWRVLEDNGDHLVIRGKSGARVLHYSEAETHWTAKKRATHNDAPTPCIIDT